MMKHRKQTARFARKVKVLWLAGRIAFWICAVSVLAKFLSLPRALNFISPRRIAPRRAVSDLQMTPYIARVIGITDRILELNFFVFTPTCWKRAAILYRYLARDYTNVRLCFGARRNKMIDALEAHAWIEINAQAAFEREPPAYFYTYIYPSLPSSPPHVTENARGA